MDSEDDIPTFAYDGADSSWDDSDTSVHDYGSMEEENVPSNQKPCFFCKKKKSYTGQWFYYPCKHAFHAICALINHEQIGRRTVCFTCPKCGLKRITKLCQDYDEWEKYVCMSYCLEREFQQKQKKKKNK